MKNISVLLGCWMKREISFPQFFECLQFCHSRRMIMKITEKWKLRRTRCVLLLHLTVSFFMYCVCLGFLTDRASKDSHTFRFSPNTRPRSLLSKWLQYVFKTIIIYILPLSRRPPKTLCWQQAQYSNISESPIVATLSIWEMRIRNPGIMLQNQAPYYLSSCPASALHTCATFATFSASRELKPKHTDTCNRKESEIPHCWFQ